MLRSTYATLPALDEARPVPTPNSRPVSGWPRARSSRRKRHR
ncbi:MAG: hypothetical protein R2851_11105 [Caldilineaceae bacterium]